MRKFPLISLTDQHLTRTKFSLPRKSYFYPSEASVKWTDRNGIEQCAGACLRQCYFRRKPEYKPLPTTPYTQWIFALGKAVEQILVEQYKEMGILVANNVKFFDPEHKLSGEVDIVLKDPKSGELIVGEVKSGYGYHFVRDVIKGTRTISPSPKTSQLLQTLLYVDILSDYFSYGKMIYYARDAADRTEYDITIMEDGTTGEKRPCIDGIVDPRFTMKDIYDRYALLDTYLQNDEIPPNDYEKVYSKEKVEKLYKLKEVGKTKYEAWQKGKEQVGHWMCRYCEYNQYCWDEKGNSLIG